MTLFDCSDRNSKTFAKELKNKDALKVSEVDNKVVSIKVSNTNFKFKLIFISVVLTILCGIVLYIKL